MIARLIVVFLLLAGTGFSQTFVGTVDGYYGYTCAVNIDTTGRTAPSFNATIAEAFLIRAH